MQYLTKRGFSNLDGATKAEANLKKLLRGRFDLWFSSNSTVPSVAKRLNVDMKDLKLVLEVLKNPIYIAFNKGTPDAIIAKWQQVYEALYMDGTVKKIFAAYRMEALFPTR